MNKTGYLAYNALLLTGAVLFAPVWIPVAFGMEKYRAGLVARLGFYSDELYSNLAGRKNIWIHAVSVGETIASEPIVTGLISSVPNARIAFSASTKTGIEQARKQFGNNPAVTVFHFPLDFNFSVKRAFDMVDPSLCLVMETELWPNFAATAHERGVPLVLANGRISDKSLKNLASIKWFIGGILNLYTALLMQTEEDAARIESLGAEREKVRVMGNVKYDRDIPPPDSAKRLELREQFGYTDSDRVIFCGSTHPVETGILANAFVALSATRPDLRLFVAPRHMTRVAEIMAELRGAGLEPVSVTEHRKAGRSDGTGLTRNKVFVLDTIGELADLYEIGDVAFVGGSLVPHGGQNPLEPAAKKRAVVMGPHIHNFREIAGKMEALSAAVHLRASDAATVAEALGRIIDQPALAEKMGEKAGEIFKSNRGAAKKCVDILTELLR